MIKSKTQTIILSNKILLKSPVLYEKDICSAFSITNPAYINSCKYGKSRFKPKKKLLFWEKKKEGIYLPRGAFEKIKAFYRNRQVKIEKIERYTSIKPENWTFKGQLIKEKGQLAIKKFTGNCGIIKAPTGTGKTVMGLWLMAKLGVPTIVVVHTGSLAAQWPNRIETFLGIPKSQIGAIGGGKLKVKGITVALMQTLHKHPKILEQFGCMIVDETHRAPCNTYVKIINNYSGKYLIGLSATPKRRDGLTSVMKWHVGGVNVSISLDKAKLCKCKYKIIPTDFKAEECFQRNYSKALVEMARNQGRNKLIVENVLKQIDFFGIHLIISQNRSQCLKLFKMMPSHIRLISRVLTGKVKEKERREIIQEAEKGKLKILIATDKLIGEGFDEPLLSVLHLTSPIADKNRLIQYVGRVRRTVKGKKEALVYDYFDPHEPILRNGAKKRVQTYRDNNITKM